MDLMMRRRALMGGANSEIKIMTSATNPILMQLFYDNGKCANPDYMTKEEAEALIVKGVTNDIQFLYNNDTNGEDFSALRYFTGVQTIDLNILNPNFSPFSDLNLSGIVLPPSFTTFKGWGGRCLVYTSEPLHVRIPVQMNFYSPTFQSKSKVTVIFDDIVPPQIISGDFIRNEWTNRLNFAIYVPDNAVQDYKDLFLSLGDVTYNIGYNKTAQQNADRIYPISEYTDSWTGGYPLNKKLI